MKDVIPFRTDCKKTRSFVQLCDKYDCRGPARVIVHGWIQQHIATENIESITDLLVAAYLHKMEDHVRALALQLRIRATQPLAGCVIVGADGEMLPPTLIGT